MNPKPQVSIVLPTFNRANLITETIQSVIGQSFAGWELLIVDDGSEDDTAKLVRSFADDRIRWIGTDHVGKLGVVRNLGLDKSRGEYIAFLDSDDLWREDKLEVQLKLFREYPGANFVFSNFNEFGVNAINPPDRKFFFGDFFRQILLTGSHGICMPTLIFKRTVLTKIGVMNEQYQSGADIDFFFRLTHGFQGVFTNQRLVNIRKHRQSSSDRFGAIVYKEQIAMLDDFYEREWITASEISELKQKLWYRMGLLQMKLGCNEEARESYRNLLKLRPLHFKAWARWTQTLVHL